jgi:hypothetical protein
VRGFERLLVCPARDLLKNAVDVAQDLIVPKSQNEITAVFQILGSARVLLALFNMLTTVKLDDQFCVWTAEINDKAIEGHLPPEFQPAKPLVAQLEPQRSFGIGLLPAQLPRNFDS